PPMGFSMLSSYFLTLLSEVICPSLHSIQQTMSDQIAPRCSGTGYDPTIARIERRTFAYFADRPIPEVATRSAKRTPISLPESRAISNLRKRIALILCNNAGHLHFYRLSPRPFSHSVGCELNRTRHPSGSSLPRCSATALVACATPEKLWCQAVSKGLLAVPMAIAAMTTPVLQWLMAWAIQHSVFHADGAKAASKSVS